MAFKKGYIILFSLLFFIVDLTSAQSYYANGDAISLGNSCYQLTTADPYKLGSVWYADKLDLSKDFDLEFYLNFGSKDGGADGIVFVLQTVGNKALGIFGGGLGFEGFSPSLGIEFDDFMNDNYGDPSYDHIAILKNGSVDHTGSESVSAPTSATTTKSNIEDGKNHLVRINWIVGEKKLKVWFDCELRHALTYDIRKKIFGSTDLVYWGFTSATGGFNNIQMACLRDDILIPDTFEICKGETKLLNARESNNNTYTWTPSTFLDNTSIRTPKCSSTVPMTYYVEYKDLCDNTYNDTVHVKIDQPFVLETGVDTLLCDGADYPFSLSSSYDSVRWSSGSTASSIVLSKEGKYTLRAWQGACYDDDTFFITTNTSPTVVVKGDSDFCEYDSVLLVLDVNPSDAFVNWPDGSTLATRYFSDAYYGRVSVTNECNTASDTFSVKKLIIDDFDLGNNRLLCVGDSVLLDASIGNQYGYLWNTLSTQSSIRVVNEGQYSVVVDLLGRCFARDSVQVIAIPPPQIGSLEDILLCVNEKLDLVIENKYGTVTWNNDFIGNTFKLDNYEGKLTVVSENQCGSDSTELEVNLIECHCNIIFPNAFTPNGDELNSIFKPIINCPKLDSYLIQIYNRWGEKIFESKNITDFWDGTYKETPVQVGVYVVVVQWSGNENGNLERKTTKNLIHVLK